MTRREPLSHAVKTFEADAYALKLFAPVGFAVGMNISWAGPRYWFSSFPDTWAEKYQKRNYFIADPVFHWSLNHQGVVRWSDISSVDVLSVGKKAAKHGLVYGAIASIKCGKVRSFLTAARGDRELLDDELELLSQTLYRWNKEINEDVDANLSDGELDVLVLLRDGLGQQEIAGVLGIAESTVKKRAQGAMRKLNARTRTHAVSKAADYGLFD